jgi:DUF4097 and DUF4098 domain-containing protein YvlB
VRGIIMEERKMILTMLNEGKITSNEAVRLLEALGTPDAEKIVGNEKEEVFLTIVDQEENKENEQNKQYKQSYKEPSLTSKISDIVDRVVKKVKDVDLDFNFSSFVEIQHIFQNQDMDFNRLKIEIPNGKVTIKPWDETGVRAECKSLVYKVETTDEARKKFLAAVTLEESNEMLHFKVSEKQVKADVVLYIPQKQYLEATLDLGNGAIDIEDLVVERLKGNTANGSVTLTRLSGNNLDIGTNNGAIDIVRGRWDRGEVETWNGTVRIDGTFKEIEAETLNGSISYYLPEKISGKAKLKTIAGKINVTLPREVEVYGQIKTFAGGLNCLLDNIEILEERKDYARKYMKFTANKGSITTYNVAAETKTGTITINKLSV